MEFGKSGKMFGYDRAITVFSPKGRLFQVEYAEKCVERAGTSIGIKCEDGVVLIGDKRGLIDKLHEPDSLKKVFKLDEHIGTALTGLVGDGRRLIKEAREEAQRNRSLYDEEIDVETLTRHVSDMKQLYTQYGGARPFGVAFLIGGMDYKGPSLFRTDPSGVYAKIKAAVLGEGKELAEAIIKKKYSEKLSVKEGIKIGLKAMKEALKEEFRALRMDIGIITKEGYHNLSQEEIKKYLKSKK